MIDCGSQVILCEYPIRLDTYKGCSHDCKYCFARSKQDISKISPLESANQVRDWAKGKRSQNTRWCDWDIPLHWGGMSDPFQPIEKKHKKSLEVLKVLRETQYPVIVSTKGRLIAEEPYLSLIGQCNIVVQISMTSPMFDKIEKGAPTFEERIEIGRKVAPNCKRLIARVQPYVTDARKSLISYLPKLKEAGFYGITVEGMKFKKKQRGLVRVRGDWCYPDERLRADYQIIREECEKVGLHFFCAENRLRGMGESCACCGCGDLEGFKGNSFNAVSILNGGGCSPTPAQQQVGSAYCFKAMNQTAKFWNMLKTADFAQLMNEAIVDLDQQMR